MYATWHPTTVFTLYDYNSVQIIDDIEDTLQFLGLHTTCNAVGLHNQHTNMI